MIYLDKAWKQLFEAIDRQKEECRALYDSFLRKRSEFETLKNVFLTPVLAGMSEIKQLELKELMKQDDFMDFIIWQ